MVWSPVDYHVYRRKIAGAGASDPSADSTNWAEISGVGDVLLDAEQTLTNKTITLGDNTISGTLAQLNTAITDATIVSTTSTVTLENKTITLGENSISGTLAQFNAAVADSTLASLGGSESLTNKTIALGSNTVSGTLSQFNAAMTDGSFVSLSGAETLENKLLKDHAEDVTALSGTTPEIGTGVNTWALSGNSTPTESLTSGQSTTLQITNPSGYYITWTAVDKWIGGGTPTLYASGTNLIELWKVGASVYGVSVGVLS